MKVASGLTVEDREDGSSLLHHPAWGEWWMVVKDNGEVETHRRFKRPSVIVFIPTEEVPKA